MKKSLLPLVIFIGGNLALLVVTLLFNPAEDATAQLAASSPNASAVLWGWDWITTPGMTKALLYTVIELGICAAAGVTYLANRK